MALIKNLWKFSKDCVEFCLWTIYEENIGWILTVMNYMQSLWYKVNFFFKKSLISKTQVFTCLVENLKYCHLCLMDLVHNLRWHGTRLISFPCGSLPHFWKLLTCLTLTFSSSGKGVPILQQFLLGDDNPFPLNFTLFNGWFSIYLSIHKFCIITGFMMTLSYMNSKHFLLYLSPIIPLPPSSS